MISVKTLISGSSVSRTIGSLVSLHRIHYNHPGLILNKQKLEQAYTRLINEIMTPIPDYNLNIVIDIQNDNKNSTLVLKVGNTLLRDWFKNNEYDLNIVQVLKLNYPKDITKDQILAEMLFELTYYRLPNYC